MHSFKTGYTEGGFRMQIVFLCFAT